MEKPERNLPKIILLSLIMVLFPTGFVKADNTLRIHPTNPRYFTDETGKAIYMTGSHTWFIIHYYADANPQMSYDDFEDYLDWMQSHGHNFIRLWTGWSNSIYPPAPWVRTGHGNALDGCGLKFNMTEFDQDYFDLVRQRVQQIENHGMYCSIMFFGSLMFTYNGDWSKVAWHPGNNINQDLANAFDVNDGHSFFTTDTGALNIQRAFVGKMIDTLNDFDHIIWEIGNEAPISESINWQNEMTVYARNYEASKPKQHLVGITSDGRDTLSFVTGSQGDWISPDCHSDNYMNGGPANYDDKIVISDTDHLWGFSQPEDATDMVKWVWESFTRGNHPIFMDPYNDVDLDQGYNGTIDPVYDGVRDAMGYTLIYANKFSDLASMIPSETISSTRYCLANPGSEYLIYQPDSGSFTVELKAGTYNYEWFNPDTGIIVESNTITVNDGNELCTPPFSGDAVLYLRSFSIVPITGDVTGDGKVDILDLQACVNHILGTQDWGSAADVNNDTAINILDIQETVNIILGV